MFLRWSAARVGVRYASAPPPWQQHLQAQWRRMAAQLQPAVATWRPALAAWRLAGEKGLEHRVQAVQEHVGVVSKVLNDVTGYSDILQLRHDIARHEVALKEARRALREAKEAYTQAIAQRLALQREVNELLQRKHAWTPDDLTRFTELYRNDHSNEQLEQQASVALEAAEQRAEEVQTSLTQSILTRYHEEQVWSDKIRRLLTWGTVGIMAVNLVLFVVVQLLLEPWKRRRLVRQFEQNMRVAMAEMGVGQVAAAPELVVSEQSESAVPGPVESAVPGIVESAVPGTVEPVAPVPASTEHPHPPPLLSTPAVAWPPNASLSALQTFLASLLACLTHHTSYYHTLITSPRLTISRAELTTAASLLAAAGFLCGRLVART